MFGWTGLGWLIALVWSLTGNTADADRHVVVTTHNAPQAVGIVDRSTEERGPRPAG